MSRSILVKARIMGMFCATHWRMHRSVFSMTPSTTSTHTTQPSAMRSAAVISPVRLMCPGVSTKFSSQLLSLESLRRSEIGVEVMLMPRSCSEIVVSVYRTSLVRLHGLAWVVSISMSRKRVLPMNYTFRSRNGTVVDVADHCDVAD